METLDDVLVLRRRIGPEKLYRLYQTSLLLNSTLDLKKILQLIISLAAQVTTAEASSLLLVDEKRQDLYFEVAEGEKQEELKNIRVPLGKGIAGAVALSGEPMLVKDAAKDKRHYKAVDDKTKFITKSILCVPLKTKDKVLGVVQVLNSLEKEGFDEEDEEVLSAMASQAAVSIENARLYQELFQKNIQVTELKNYLSNILRSTPEAVIVLDNEGVVTTFDDNAEKFLQLKMDEVVGRHFKQAFTLNFTDFVQNLLVRTTELEHVIDAEFEAPGDSETPVPVGFSTSKLVDDQFNVLGTVIVGRDLTETKKILILEELSRMKSDFVNTVSHELRTPLTSIKGFISTLIEDTEGYFDEDRKRHFYKIIHDETDRLGRLINDLLDVSRIEAGKALTLNLDTVNLSELVLHMVEIQKAYTKKHNFVAELPENEVSITADRDKVEQMTMNYLSNAVKYSPEGGDVKVCLTDNEHEVALSVKDPGLGIPKDQIGKLFQKFMRVTGTKSETIRGTGIGLHLVKYLVELHGGRVWVESELNKGSTFGFTLSKNIK